MSALWRAVHAALDERRDPMADPEVTAALAEEPEEAPRLLRLLDRLGALDAPPVTPRAPRVHAGHAAAAAGILLALGLAWASAAGPRPGRPAQEAGGEPAGSAGQVLAWRVTITHRTPEGTSRTICEDGRVRVEGRASLGDDASIALLHHNSTR